MVEFMHKIKARLYKNLLTHNPNDYSARVVSEKSLSVKGICESAVARGGADVSAVTMEHSVNLWFKEMAYRLCDGFAVKTPWFNAHPSIRGVFSNRDETFNPEKHNIFFSFHQGTQLRKELEAIEVEVIGEVEGSFHIGHVLDTTSGSENDILTPNMPLKIWGHKIKIEGDNPANGVYFVHQATKERIKVAQNSFVDNNPSEITVVTPNLPLGGTYQLEIITQYSSNKAHVLKDLRTAVFGHILTTLEE
jgi:hypothetical protein